MTLGWATQKYDNNFSTCLVSIAWLNHTVSAVTSFQSVLLSLAYKNNKFSFWTQLYALLFELILLKLQMSTIMKHKLYLLK